MWNDANPNSPVHVTIAEGDTEDQKRAMIDAAANDDADLINPDIIHLRDFAARGLITPIELENVNGFLPATLRASLVDGDESRYWAAPFNTDAGTLFERLRSAGADASVDGLADVIDRSLGNEAAIASPEFVGQLQPSPSTAHEAFVVNVLEHALSRDEGILDESGYPNEELNRWRDAVEPLRMAVVEGRIALSNTEGNAALEFAERELQFMRNWPVYYRELHQLNDPAVRESRILVRPLPLGILGGQSLALVGGSQNASAAIDLIHFLASDEAQKVLSAHGLAPTRSAAYNDDNLKAFIPHLDSVRAAVETARTRPIHPNYSEFSEIVRRHMTNLLHEDVDLPSQFIDEMRAALD